MTRPKRMRGYYRAVKRGEPWALKLEKLGRFTLSWMLGYYMPEEILLEELMRRDALFLNLPKPDEWRGRYLPIPLIVK